MVKSSQRQELQRPPLDPVIEAYKRDVDVSLLLENLRMTVEERLIALASLGELIDEMQRGVRLARAGR